MGWAERILNQIVLTINMMDQNKIDKLGGASVPEVQESTSKREKLSLF